MPAFLFLFGIFVGSFLNVVVDRVPRKEGIVVGHSHCDFCGHILAWYDLIPLFSFLLLRGKCRYCHKFIGWKYPIIELTTGFSFAFTAFFFMSSFVLVTTLAIISCLIVLSYTDFFSGIIPDGILVFLLLFSFIRLFLLHSNIFLSLCAGFTTGLLFLIIFLFTKQKGIGFGDVKYALVMGILLGFPDIITGLYLAFLTGAIVALILIVGGKKRFGQSIPLGPFLVIGTVANLFFGQQLWQIFSRILGI